MFPCPEYLTAPEAAALPLIEFAAYRTVFTKSQVEYGVYVLVTGVGGCCIAVTAVQFAVAAGAHVYVTSSSVDKIEFAMKLGAEGSVNYNKRSAIVDLKNQPRGHSIRTLIDGSGCALFDGFHQVLEAGGVITYYGNNANYNGVRFPTDLWTRNIELKGTIMGSRVEFGKMLEFVEKHHIRSVISASFKGITQENVEKSIELLA